MKLSYTYYESEDGWFVGHFDDYPDYDTQGRSPEDLETMLNSLYRDMELDKTVPAKRKELELAS
ncbi:hypothetical protein [Treponema primitia]|uniref:hypothetical protein n=1 Tax=Treponema primitia TaxID=88058 RepID=UPI00025553A4|nr:hypothetical protein [Treponema primitia]